MPNVSNVIALLSRHFARIKEFEQPFSDAARLGVHQGRDPMTDQLPTFSKTTEFQGHLNNPRRIAELIARCFDRATLDIGPIFRISRDLGDPFRRCPGLCPPAVSM